MIKNRVLVIICCLFVGALLVTTVHANPIETTLVNYSIFQDNQPVNDPIDLSVKTGPMVNTASKPKAFT
jgi:hypothetical protein